MMHTPKKELGQHWLHDISTLDAIVAAAAISPGDSVMEIGPGLGTLTDRLLLAEADVVALEYDRDLLVSLQKKYANHEHITLVEGDIRTFDLTKLTSPYVIVANIPYYLTSNLIRILTETNNPPSRAVLLVQKEVAERVCAPVGKMSALSVVAQFFYECHLGLSVPSVLFTPPPKIDSQVIVMKRREELPFKVTIADYFRLVKAGFSERRKSLRNALSGGLRVSKAEAENLLSEAGIDSSLRAQALSLDDWYRLYLAYESRKISA